GGADIDYYYYYGDLIAANTIVGAEYNSYSSPGVPHISNGVNGNIVYTTTTTLESLNISNSLAINGSANGVKTLAVSAGSSVINAGASATNGSYSTPALDQRGASRTGATDIGPYEYDGVVGAPYLSSKYPADNATSVAVNSNLALYFNKTVNAQAGSDNDITIKKVSDNSIVEAIDAQSAQITGSGTATITINPASNLDENIAYYVLVGTDAFDDTISNSFSGISVTTEWSFTTADATAPTITSISSDKANGSYRVGEVIDIDVTFSEAVTSTGNVTVTLETGDTDRTCTFSISNSSTGTCNYTVQSGDNSLDLSASVSGTIKDQSNNSLTSYTPVTGLSANKSLIIDTTNPTVLYFSPANGASNFGVDSSLEIAFSENIATSSGYIVIYKSSDDSIIETFDISSISVTASGTSALIINPTASLAGETSYYVLMDGNVIDDTAGNSFAGVSASSTWVFTT
ncbi:MAG: Ig-like domain-containing protein, partial [Candidatus Saccharibacteria bacterium]|nr:Ig-like domain-containing protein [Candidatus Saccharibacteria bacterium]